MSTIAEALKPFLAHELPQGTTVADTPGPGVEVGLPLGDSGWRWFKRRDTRRYRFEFRPEVLTPLQESAEGIAQDVSGLEHVAYLEHVAAVMGHAVEQHGAEGGKRDLSLSIGMTDKGDLDVRLVSVM
ncbi:MAG: hypothetical protein V4505_22705 [Pseudomonadota bacterium]